MQERKIYCCGSRVWTRVIGCYQIIASTAVALPLAIILSDPANNGISLRSSDGNIRNTESDLQRAIIEAFLYSFPWFIFLFQLILSLLDCFMGMVLLHGALKQNTQFLYYWIVYTVASILTWAVLILAECFTLEDLASCISEVVSIFIGVTIQSFCLWVVSIHKTEIEYAAAEASATSAVVT